MSIGATHFYGKLQLVQQCTDPDYGPITLDNIEEWAPGGIDIQLKRKLTMKTAKELDEKHGGNTYQYSVSAGVRTLTEGWDSIEELTKFAIKKYKSLKLNCDFISLYEGEKFKDTVIIKNNNEVN
jgi:hypothetical protein